MSPVQTRRDILNAQPAYEKTLSVKTKFEDKSAPQLDVKKWLDQCKPQDPCNTPARRREKCVPLIETRRDKLCDQPKPAPANVRNTIERSQCSSTQGKTDAALVSRVLQENRLPKPKIIQFDGDPKRYTLSMASFCINADEVLEECENKLKLTLQPDEGHRTARNKQKQISEWRAAARNYKEKTIRDDFNSE